MNDMTANSYEKNDKSGVVICHICYGLYALGLITFITPIIGMWINYFNRSYLNGSIAMSVFLSHHNWMIKTFWMLIWILIIKFMMINIVTSQITSVLVQSIILLTIGITFLVWYIYRIVKGWRRLCQRKSIG